MANQPSYWNGNGTHQALYTKLSALIPDSGSVPNARTTGKHLEKLRKAANCYYDLFNNGLGNRAQEFNRVFGFSGTWIAKSRFPHVQTLEDKMDEFILAAAKEQGVHLEGYEDAQLQIELYINCVARERSSTAYYIKHGIKIETVLPVAY